MNRPGRAGLHLEVMLWLAEQIKLPCAPARPQAKPVDPKIRRLADAFRAEDVDAAEAILRGEQTLQPKPKAAKHAKRSEVPPDTSWATTECVAGDRPHWHGLKRCKSETTDLSEDADVGILPCGCVPLCEGHHEDEQ